MIKVSKARLVELCGDEDVDVRTDYSGRYMYGKSCIGVVGNAGDLLRFALIIVPQLADDDGEVPFSYDEEWFRISQDSMAMDLIFYWPSIQAVDDNELTDDVIETQDGDVHITFLPQDPS